MTSISIGPLALPLGPALLLLAMAVAMLAIRRMAPADGDASAPQRAGDVPMHAVLIGLLAARVVYVMLHGPAYRAEPWTVLDLRDGGFHATSGLAAGLAWVVWQVWRRAVWRRALAVGTTAGLAIWFAGQAWMSSQAPKALPEATLVELDSGLSVRLRAVAAQRPVVLNLWASWCGPCRQEMPALAEAQARHPGVAFVFANQGESAQVVRHYLDSERLVLSNVLLDARSQLGPALGSRGLPTTVFVDAQGQVLDVHMGALNRAALSARLQSERMR